MILFYAPTVNRIFLFTILIKNNYFLFTGLNLVVQHQIKMPHTGKSTYIFHPLLIALKGTIFFFNFVVIGMISKIKVAEI